ncbi:MAG: 4-hydroxy-tetrahydrodipicolinate reductase [Dehalococcoidia bacterium]|nr:4-hydroxy-tetrahydrodipicolinate reductase [Dehalococcoidia bacterium]
MSIKVAVHGAFGKMGQMVIAAVGREPDLSLVGGIDLKASGSSMDTASGRIPCGTDPETILRETHPEVLVDFSVASAVMPLAIAAAAHRVHLVSGTTGLSADELKKIDELARTSGIGAVIAANFALGAVVMMHLAEIAARYFDYAEIIEEHHEQKRDAPSGTALSTAKLMAEARRQRFSEPKQEEPSASRGQNTEGIAIHSVRLPGLVARQEVLFGALGQTLSVKHEAISRECYMPGVITAIKMVGQLQGLVSGLDKLLGL